MPVGQSLIAHETLPTMFKTENGYKMAVNLEPRILDIERSPRRADPMPPGIPRKLRRFEGVGE